MSLTLKTRIRSFIRPYYLIIFKGRRHIQNELEFKVRDWDVSSTLPEKTKEAAIQSILSGKVSTNFNSTNQTVVLYAAPKSASLYLTQLFSSTLEFKNFQIGFDEKGGETYYPRLLQAATIDLDTISHCHNTPTPQICNLIDKLNITPIILYRNLLDSLVSRRDMLINSGWATYFLSKQAINKFINGSEEYQLDVTISLFADEYLNFFTSWKEYAKSNHLLFITYEELLDNESNLVKKVGDYLGIDYSEKKLEEVSQKIKSIGGINFNKGTADRGANLFSTSQINRIREKANYFECSDAPFLGITV